MERILREKTEKTKDGRFILYPRSKFLFDKFDVDKTGILKRGEGEYANDGFLGKAIYFTLLKNTAKKYGKHVYTCAVDLRNPCIWYGHWKDILEDVFSKKDIEEFKKKYWEENCKAEKPMLGYVEQEKARIKRWKDDWENQTLKVAYNWIILFTTTLNKKYGTNKLTQWYKKNKYDSFVLSNFPEFDFVNAKKAHTDTYSLDSTEIVALDASQVEILDIKSPAKRSKIVENWTTNRFLRRLYEK